MAPTGFAPLMQFRVNGGFSFGYQANQDNYANAVYCDNNKYDLQYLIAALT